MADSPVAAVGMVQTTLPQVVSNSRGLAAETDSRLAPQRVVPEADKSLQAMKDAARQFESYFTYMMLKEMRKSVPKDGILSSGIGHDIYQSMYDEAIDEVMSKTESLVLSKALVDQYFHASGGGGSPPLFKLPDGISEKGAGSLSDVGRRSSVLAIPR